MELGMGMLEEIRYKTVTKKLEGTCRKDDPRTFTVVSMLLQSCGKTGTVELASEQEEE
jgi:hypothetical protein